MTPCPKCNSTMELDADMVHRCESCDHSETWKRELEMYRAIDRLESLLTEKPADAK